MCGRYALDVTTEEAIERFQAQLAIFELAPRFNIAPTQDVPIVRQKEGRQIEGYRWGLIPFWAKDPSIGNRMINARAESLLDKSAFRGCLERGRCLIPASGFYEWRAIGEGKTKKKQPLYIHRADGELMAFAGLWDQWRTPDGGKLRSCTIITTDANEFMAPLHDRMPAILDRDAEAAWLSGEFDEDLLKLLQPYPLDDLQMHEVTTRMNKPDYEEPDCIEPLEQDQGTLFGVGS